MFYLGGEFPFGTHVISGLHIDIVLHLICVVSHLSNSCYLRAAYRSRAQLDYYILFEWQVPYGTDVISGQDIDIVLHYYVFP